MFLLNWYREFLRIRLENEGLKINLSRERVCESCEYLKMQVEKEQQLNKELIDKLTFKSTEVAPMMQQNESIKPRFIPWNVRKQQLEQQEKLRASQVMKETEQRIQNANETKIAPADDPDVLELEREMDLISKAREQHSSSGGVKFDVGQIG